MQTQIVPTQAAARIRRLAGGARARGAPPDPRAAGAIADRDAIADYAPLAFTTVSTSSSCMT